MTFSDRSHESIRALGRIEGFKNDVRLLRETIDQASMWRPAAALKKQCDRILHVMADLEARFDRKLVVTLIGPSGSGKSTLLNALAGVDNLSETGTRRPTTRNVVVLCREKGDIAQLSDALGKDQVQMRFSFAASLLEHVILIDTPDTDSTEQEKHIPILQKAITLSDILICVFDAENPKRRDHVDFLAPYVRLFNGDSLVSVINKCDRQDEHELKQNILPEFLKYIQTAWDKPINTGLCISARRHLQNPGWSPEALPRHEFDQFDKLQQLIFGTFNRPGYVIDRRLENALNLKNYIYTETGSEAGNDLESLEAAEQNIRETQTKALNEARAAFENSAGGQQPGVNVLLFQKLAHRWLGPVGWIVALWARILIFSTGVAAMFRFGSPFRQLLATASSLKRFKEPHTTPMALHSTPNADDAVRNYRLAVMQDWPDIAETLVKSRFDPSVRNVENMLPDTDTLNRDLANIWYNALESVIETTSDKLSRVTLQFVFNLPVIMILVHAGWITVRNYFNGIYLPFDFFLHALLAIGIVLFLTFFLLQGCVRLVANSERITAKAFERVKQHIEQLKPLSMNPVSKQAAIVRELAAFSRPEAGKK